MPANFGVGLSMAAAAFRRRSITSWPVAVEPDMAGVRVIAVVDVSMHEVDYRYDGANARTALIVFNESLVSLARGWLGRDSIERFVVVDCIVTIGLTGYEANDGYHLHVIDLLTRAEFFERGRSVLAYRQRRPLLVHAFSVCELADNVHLVTPFYVLCFQAIYDLVDRIAAAGGRGVIVKALDGHYQCHRGDAWMKLSYKNLTEGRVTGAFCGRGPHNGRLGGLHVSIGSADWVVTDGFSDQQRDDLWRDYQIDHANAVVLARYAEHPYEIGRVLNRSVEIEYSGPPHAPDETRFARLVEAPG